MELVNLPQKTQTQGAKLYKHFKVDPGLFVVSSGLSRKEFFFVGTATHKITFLLNVFDGGYTAESGPNAISLLRKNIVRGIVPEILIIDGALGVKAVESLVAALSNYDILRTIPVVLDASSVPLLVQQYRRMKMLDDIVFLDSTTPEKLSNTTAFLRKMKGARKSTRPMLEESVRRESTLSYICKRTFDILISSVAIIALSPVFLIIALLIRLTSKGPVFFVAKRAGRGYKIFNFYKFRTMVADADKKVSQLAHLNQYGDTSGGPVFFKVSNDPRITKVGAFLRNTSLDELPQLFNVLLGDMSIVGNRPLPLYEAETLTTDDCAARFMAPAGITGLWQIKKRGCGDMSARERVDLDINYAERNNFVYDLWIIANTPSALLQKENV